jgi:hypothetical protein
MVSTPTENTLLIGYFEERRDLIRVKPVNLADLQCPAFKWGVLYGQNNCGLLLAFKEITLEKFPAGLPHVQRQINYANSATTLSK